MRQKLFYYNVLWSVSTSPSPELWRTNVSCMLVSLVKLPLSYAMEQRCCIDDGYLGQVTKFY